jgi:hypothetical protein
LKSHAVDIYNRWSVTGRWHFKYEINCDGSTIMHEGDVEVPPGYKWHDEATTYTAVQRERAGSYQIVATTKIEGIAGDSKTAKATLRIS